MKTVYAALTLPPVSYESGGVPGAPHLDRGEAYLHCELGAVAVLPRELTPDTHVPCSWRGKEISKVA